MKFPLLTLFALYLFSVNLIAQENDHTYWKVTDHRSILWDVANEDRLPHTDNIEMAGKNVAAIIYYEIDENKNLSLKRDVIFPQLRTFNKSNEPEWKKYRAYFRRTLANDAAPLISFNEKTIIASQIDSVEIGGMITFYATPVEGLKVTRTIYPSMEDRFIVEQWEVQNIDTSEKNISIANFKIKQTELGYKGTYTMEAFSDAKESISLAGGTSYSFPVYYGATLNQENSDNFNAEQALKQRNQFLNTMYDNLALKTPNDTINTLFYFSKIRASESIYNSSMGLVHSPGGGNYYVGIWANDQVEYSGPFFPYLGYETGNTAAFNTYKKFLENIPEGDAHIPYAFEVDGIFPMKHLDRGDAAMIAYGTSHYVLSSGNLEKAKELWPLIEWSLEYCHNKRNESGAVMSQSDEMEGRIETGDANLSTSTLYYGGLKYSIGIAKELGFLKKARMYEARLSAMESVLEDYFGATIDGLDTYRYFDGNKNFRHWICLPLTMGITTRQEGTIKALFEKLWTNNGVLVELNKEKENEDVVFWDRATLYALRGAIRTDGLGIAYEKLKHFSQKRLLGNHVPYVIEAFPENNMRHLSAESALYCRIFTEGLLGIEPIGFNKIQMKPHLPSEWNSLEFKNVFISGSPMDISLRRESKRMRLKITSGQKTLFNRRLSPNQSIVFDNK